MQLHLASSGLKSLYAIGNILDILVSSFIITSYFFRAFTTAATGCKAGTMVAATLSTLPKLIFFSSASRDSALLKSMGL
jgi:hypothetical protein